VKTVAFDMKVTKEYERWFLTPSGMYVDDKEKECVLAAMRFKRGERVLNIGCGTGRYVEYFKALGIAAHGVEPVPELAKAARQKSEVGAGSVTEAPYEELPFEDNSYDSAVFITTFEFATDRARALKEALRVAKNKVGIGFLNRKSLNNFFNVKARRAIYRESNQLTMEEILAYVKEALGESKAEITGRYTIYLPVNMGYLAPIADDLLEKTRLPFGSFGMVAVKKK
jgi:ubiquinone/menaquinone biosynthesis C-methylase UbiE